MPVSLGDPQPALLVDHQRTDGVEAVCLPWTQKRPAASAAYLAGRLAVGRENLHLLVRRTAAYVEAAQRIHRQVGGVVQPGNQRRALARLRVDGQHGVAIGDGIHQAVAYRAPRPGWEFPGACARGRSLHHTRPAVQS